MSLSISLLGKTRYSIFSWEKSQRCLFPSLCIHYSIMWMLLTDALLNPAFQRLGQEVPGLKANTMEQPTLVVPLRFMDFMSHLLSLRRLIILSKHKSFSQAQVKTFLYNPKKLLCSVMMPHCATMIAISKMADTIKYFVAVSLSLPS